MVGALAQWVVRGGVVLELMGRVWVVSWGTGGVLLVVGPGVGMTLRSISILYTQAASRVFGET